MTSEQFNKLVETCCKEIRETLSKKAGDYAGDKDRLQNFKDAANDCGLTPEFCLWMFNLKHRTALKDYIYRLDEPPEFQPTEEQLLEKIGDTICYLILLKGLLIDRGLIKEYKERNGI